MEKTAIDSVTDLDLAPVVFDVPAAGGGTIRAYSCGPADAPVVVGIHGAPGTGVEDIVKYVGNAALYCRLVTFDRPGYAGSADVPEPQLSATAGVVEAVLDHMEVDVVSVYGHSAGGPRALAAAALLPERISRVATVGGCRPSTRPGFEPDAVRRRVMAELQGSVKDGQPEDWDALYTYSDVRVAEVFRPPVEAILAKHLEMPDFDGDWWVEGYVNDCVALAAPWGFDLGSIRVPTRLFHGAADRMVPVSASEWLATEIPGAEAESFLHMGHRLDQLMPYVYAWLVQDMV